MKWESDICSLTVRRRTLTIGLATSLTVVLFIQKFVISNGVLNAKLNVELVIQKFVISDGAPNIELGAVGCTSDS